MILFHICVYFSSCEYLYIYYIYRCHEWCSTYHNVLLRILYAEGDKRICMMIILLCMCVFVWVGVCVLAFDRQY